MSSAENSSERLPPRTTPTWEMELLISGATVFALFQLPGALDQGLYGSRTVPAARCSD